MDSVALHKQKKQRFAVSLGVGLLLILAMLIASIGTGAMSIPFSDTARMLYGKLFANAGMLADYPANQIAVVWDIRLPRILCGLLVGMGLSTAGVIFQALLNNPLADPYTLGVSTGAAFGASLAILLNILYGWMLPTTPFAFGFAMLALLVVLLIAGRSGGFASGSLVIAGIIVSAILSSAISFLRMLAGENVGAIVQWTMGSLTGTHYPQAGLLVAVVVPCIVVACIFSSDLNVMMTGDRTAASLGITLRRMRLLYLLLGAMITAACVSVSGIIGFVGLVVPHMLRRVVGADNRVLLPLSAIYGAVLLMAADHAARLIGSGEIPVGVLTTLIGGPFFIYVFTRKPAGRV